MNDVVRARVTVRGRVQGVFYRQSTQEKARSLKLVGWVRNEDDGSVQFEAVGRRETVEELIAWSRKGPPSARVDAVDVEWDDSVGAVERKSFDVLR